MEGAPICPSFNNLTTPSQAFTGEIIYDCKNAKSPPIDERIGGEVQRPALIRAAWPLNWHARAQGSLTPAPAAHLQAFLSV
jgi:hypothetical protein